MALLILLCCKRTQKAKIPNVPALLEGSSGLGYPCAAGLIHAEIDFTGGFTRRHTDLTELQLHQKVVEGDATYSINKQDSMKLLSAKCLERLQLIGGLFPPR